jgi:hypothetical protein
MSTIPERWLPVTGWECRYEVSDLGRVRSLRHHYGPRTVPRTLKWKFDGKGYPRVTLYSGSPRTPRDRAVHHLVLEAFVGPCPEDMEARHGPGGRTDARLVNLCWGTRTDNNTADKLRDGTDNRGERHGNAKLTAEAVITIRRRAAAGELQKVLAREFGVARQTISTVVLKRSWAHM